jgi:hypothetical protein
MNLKIVIAVTGLLIFSRMVTDNINFWLFLTRNIVFSSIIRNV